MNDSEYSLQNELQRFQPFNEQEETDTRLVMELLRTVPDLYSRENAAAHFTASAWITNAEHNQILMCYHKLYHSWSWLGGHADGEHDLRHTALREVREESGLQHIRLVSPHIFSVEILTVNGHEKHGCYVPSHLHLNVTYLIEADPAEPLQVKEDENSGLRWFSPEEAVRASSEPWFQERIYRKLNAKLQFGRFHT